jgi:WD repeat and SOF domain-containing protein 1
MQHVFCVGYSSDSRFVLSGSDDTNIRIWKNNAAESLGTNAGRQERRLRLDNTLKKRFAHMPEIKRISKEKKLPRRIKKAKNIQQIQLESQSRKIENRKRHSAAGSEDLEPERKRSVLKEFA